MWRPCAGKHASLHETACTSTCGLDALIACHMGAMSWLDAAPNPCGQRQHTVARYARPTPLRRAFSLFFFASSKNGNAALKGLVAPNRHPAGAGNITGCDGVRGKPPQKPARGRAFLLAGAAKFCGSPGPLQFAGANVRGWTWILKISNFSEIEFSVHVPLHYFSS